MHRLGPKQASLSPVMGKEPSFRLKKNAPFGKLDTSLTALRAETKSHPRKALDVMRAQSRVASAKNSQEKVVSLE